MNLCDLAGHFYDNPEAHFTFVGHDHDGFITTLHIACGPLHLRYTPVAYWKVEREELYITLLDCPDDFADDFDHVFN